MPTQRGAGPGDGQRGATVEAGRGVPSAEMGSEAAAVRTRKRGGLQLSLAPHTDERAGGSGSGGEDTSGDSGAGGVLHIPFEPNQLSLFNANNPHRTLHALPPLAAATDAPPRPIERRVGLTLLFAHDCVVGATSAGQWGDS